MICCRWAALITQRSRHHADGRRECLRQRCPSPVPRSALFFACHCEEWKRGGIPVSEHLFEFRGGIPVSGNSGVMSGNSGVRASFRIPRGNSGVREFRCHVREFRCQSIFSNSAGEFRCQGIPVSCQGIPVSELLSNSAGEFRCHGGIPVSEHLFEFRGGIPEGRIMMNRHRIVDTELSKAATDRDR